MLVWSGGGCNWNIREDSRAEQAPARSAEVLQQYRLHWVHTVILCGWYYSIAVHTTVPVPRLHIICYLYSWPIRERYTYTARILAVINSNDGGARWCSIRFGCVLNSFLHYFETDLGASSDFSTLVVKIAFKLASPIRWWEGEYL